MISKKIRTCFLALLLLFLVEPALAQVNLTATAGTLTGSYTTLNAAFTAINAGTHQGVINIDITANTTEGATPAALNASGSGSANYTSVTIRPTTAVTISGTPAANRGIIELNGADNVTIDGDAVGGPVQRDLTIINNSPSSTNNTAVIRLVGSATVGNCSNNVIQNCVIVGNLDGTSYTTATYSAGIYGANGSATPTITNSNTNGIDYDNITIHNNEISKAYVGIAMRSSSTTSGVNDNLTITQNIIGSNTPADYVVFRGIQLENINGGNISQNTVFNIRLLASVGTTNTGIDLFGAGTNNVNITRNKIYGIASPSTGGWGAYGINATAGTNTTIANNVIYDITTTHYSATSQTYNAFGIRLGGGTGYKVWYNSVHIYGDYSTAGTSGSASAAFCVTSTTVTGDIRNNIFANKLTASGTTSTQKEHKAAWFPTSFNFSNVTLNNNSYNIPAATAGTEHFVGKVGTTVGTGNSNDLAAWQTATGQDGLSVPVSNTNAPFTADNDLTIPANTNTPIESGAAVVAITNDYDNYTRPRTTGFTNPNLAPDIGAYEFDGLNGVPNDVGILNLVNPVGVGCYGASENVTVTIRNYGTATLPAGTNIPVTVNVTGAVTTTLTGTYTVGSMGFGPLSNVTYTLPTTLNMTTAGTYTFNASTAMTSPADGNTSNDAMAPVNRTVVAPLALPYTENFNSYPDASVPPGWTVDIGSTYDFKVLSNHGAGGGNNGFAANLYSGNNSSFAIMPKLGPFGTSSTFSFDYRIVDFTGYANPGGTATTLTTTDSIYIEYSTDCGVTYTKVPGSVITSTTHTTSNLFVNKSITLPGALSGQNVIFRWIGKWGAGDYYVDIDNINITSCPVIPPPTNTTPPANLTICSGNSTTLSVSGGVGTFKWYDAPTGGTLLFTGATYTTPVLTTTTTYYAEEDQSGCTSTRTSITVTVNPLPAAPTIASIMPNDTVCTGTVVTVTMSGTGTIKWYDNPSGGTPYFTGPVISGPAGTTDSAYVTVDNGTCESSPRVKVKIVVNPLPNVNYNVPASQDTVCTTDAPFTLTGGTPSGGTYSGGSYVTGGTTFNPALAGIGSKMVIYTYTDGNGCTNSDTSYIVVQVCTEVKNAMSNNSYYLGQTYPNPTSNTANLDIYVPKTERVIITLMSLEGKVLRTILEDNVSGAKTLQIDTSDLPAGMYLYRMQAGSYTDLKRMSVIK